MKKIKKAFNILSLIFILGTCSDLAYSASLQSYHNALRVPIEDLERAEETLDSVSDKKIIKTLSSDNVPNKEKDDALVELDKIDNPYRIVSIIKEIFAYMRQRLFRIDLESSV